MAGLFSRFYQHSRRWNGPYPRWFEDWLIVEREAVSLRIWRPIIINGLLQTADYARALFLGAQSDLSDDVLEQMVAARTSRQVILDGPEPPNLLVVLDETVLHRIVGSPKIMNEQLVHLAASSSRSHISVQVIPTTVGAHAGLGGAFTIAVVDGKPDAMHVDSVEGITVEKSAVVPEGRDSIRPCPGRCPAALGIARPDLEGGRGTMERINSLRWRTSSEGGWQ